jgi:tungstate transport system ATP-binding protein
MTTSLHFHGLHKAFGPRSVLDGVDLQLHAGQLTLLTGPNGAGKSTLLKILAGIDRPDRGGLLHDGRPLGWQRAKSRLRSRLIYLHQQPYLYDRSVLDNLLYGLDGPRAARRDQARQVLDEVGLSYLAGRDATGLSGGERQRLALARALLRNPDYLLLDEPTASLDPQARDLCLQLLCGLRERGIGLLVASHDLAQQLSLADHHWHLQDGQLQCLNPADTVQPAPADATTLPFPTLIAGGKP